MKKSFSAILVVLLIVSSLGISKNAQAEDSPSISIKLKNYLGNQTQVTVTVQGEYDVPNSTVSLVEGKTYKVKVENNAFSLYENSNFITSFPSLTLSPKEYGTKNVISINNRPYLGSMKFVIENGTTVRPINTLLIEDYLKGVVPMEMMASWNREALKAQAVAARTYAVRYKALDMDDTINYQVYGGYVWNSNSTAAVEETTSQTLTYNGKLIDAFFSASNGGMTESNANVWGGTQLDYLPIKADPYDKKVPWSFSIRKTQIDLTGKDLANPQNWWNSTVEADSALSTNLKNWLYQNGYANYEIKLVAVPVLSFSNEKTTSGRVKYANITLQFLLKDKVNGGFVMDTNNLIKLTTVPYVNINATKIRAMFGSSNMRSYLVSSLVDNGTSYTASGFGDGHGVGMSQWGAKTMADQGLQYQDILKFYYPGTILTNATPAVSTSTSAATGVVTTTNTTANTAPSSVAASTNQAVTVNKTAPVITNVTASYSAKNNQLSLGYSVNQDSIATVYLKNSSGTTISYLMKNKSLSSGKQQIYYSTSALKNGTYTLGISLTNNDGMPATASKAVTVNKLIPVPVVTSFSDKDTMVTGTALPNSKLTIVNGTKVMGSGTASAFGKYSIKISKLSAGTKLTVTAKDSLGNTSKPAALTVLDKTAPAVPKVYVVTSRDSILTGLSEKNAKIIVKTGSRVIGTGKADAKGKFRVSIPRQKSKTSLNVTAQDLAGNLSSSVGFKVK